MCDWKKFEVIFLSKRVQILAGESLCVAIKRFTKWVKERRLWERKNRKNFWWKYKRCHSNWFVYWDFKEKLIFRKVNVSKVFVFLHRTEFSSRFSFENSNLFRFLPILEGVEFPGFALYILVIPSSFVRFLSLLEIHSCEKHTKRWQRLSNLIFMQCVWRYSLVEKRRKIKLETKKWECGQGVTKRWCAGNSKDKW